jgi:hypothetical protein
VEVERRVEQARQLALLERLQAMGLAPRRRWLRRMRRKPWIP